MQAQTPIRLSAQHVQLAHAFRKAMKGLGTDDDALISLLATTSNEDLQAVRVAFKQEFGRSLADDVHSETSGNYRRCCDGLVLSYGEFDANIVHDAVAGLGTDEETLIEVLCTRFPAELAAASQSYRLLFGTQMLQDVKDDVSGDLKRLLSGLITSPRTAEPSEEQFEADMKTLYEAGEGRWGTDEDAFVSIFSSRPKPYVERLGADYARRYNKVIEKILKSEFSGWLKKALLILATPYVDFFADKIYKSMKGIGTNDAALVRMIVTLKGRGLKQVCAHFAFKYKKTMYEMVKSDTTGDYRKLLLAVIDNWGK